MILCVLVMSLSTIAMALLCTNQIQNLRKKIAELMNTSKKVILLLEWRQREQTFAYMVYVPSDLCRLQSTVGISTKYHIPTSIRRQANLSAIQANQSAIWP